MPRRTPYTEEERKEIGERFRVSRVKAAEERKAGLRPALKNRAAAKLVQPPIAAPIDLTQTPEFKAAVEAVKRELLAVVAQQTPVAFATAPSDGLQQTMEQLALTIGDLTNQNSGQKLVSPEVLAERREADRRMRLAIAACQTAVQRGQEKGNQQAIDDAMPRYRLVAKIIAPLMFGDELVEPMRRGADNLVHPTEIDWLLPPSLAMVPLNEPAREIFACFKASIGNQTNTRIRGIQGKGANAEPIFDTREHDDYMITPKGNIVTGGNPTLRDRNTIGDTAENTASPDRGVARIRGQEAMRQHSGPPTIQVRTLGTIAPPAVQNG